MNLFDFMAMGFCLSMAINLTGIFFQAFLNGGETTVTVNSFGEQWFDMGFFPCAIIMGIVTLIRMWRKRCQLNNF